MPDGILMEQISFSDKSIFKNKNKHYVVIITNNYITKPLFSARIGKIVEGALKSEELKAF